MSDTTTVLPVVDEQTIEEIRPPCYRKPPGQRSCPNPADWILHKTCGHITFMCDDCVQYALTAEGVWWCRDCPDKDRVRKPFSYFVDRMERI